MKTIIQLCFSLFLLLTPFLVFSASLPQPKQDYSADFQLQVVQSPGAEPLVIPGRIFYSGGSERRETEMMGRKSISIRRLDKQVIWVLMPENRMYMESSLAERQQDQDPAAAMLEQDLRLTKLGSEKVNGVQTDKYRAEVTEPGAEPMAGFLWLSRENIPIRMDMKGRQQDQVSRFIADTKNLKLGPQPAHLFTIPDGYRRLQVPTFGTFGRPAGKKTMQPDAPTANPGSMQVSPEQMEQLRQQIEQLQKQMGTQ